MTQEFTAAQRGQTVTTNYIESRGSVSKVKKRQVRHIHDV